MWKIIKKDFDFNRGNYKGFFIVFFFRISNYISNNRFLLIRFLGYPIVLFYFFIFDWVMGVDIPPKVIIGSGLQIWHGMGLVINKKVIIGKNCVLRHTTTIGNKVSGGGCPIIGDNVEIGAHSIIIGDIKIGNNVIIGAGSIVTKSLPDNSIAFGNPINIKFKDI